MLVNIIITVDIDELEIDATTTSYELTTEYWGRTSTESWRDVEINSIIFDGRDAELLSDEDQDTVEQHVLTNGVS